jgi:hypothetical protein
LILEKLHFDVHAQFFVDGFRICGKDHVQEVEECFALVVANTNPSLCLLDE